MPRKSSLMQKSRKNSSLKQRKTSKSTVPFHSLIFLVVGILIGAIGKELFDKGSHFSLHADQNVSLYFSPNGGCTKAIVERIDQAQDNIYVMAYSFTSAEIIHALKRAHLRGVKIKILVDHKQDELRSAKADEMVKIGIPTHVDMRGGCFHHKVMVIDHCYTLFGSFNFSRAAEKVNRENLAVIYHEGIAKAFIREFHKQWNNDKVIKYVDWLPKKKKAIEKKKK